MSERMAKREQEKKKEQKKLTVLSCMPATARKFLCTRACAS